MKSLLIIVLFLVSQAQAQEIDQRLQTYVRNFNLRPLSPPPTVNSDLARLGQQLFSSRLASGNKNISCMDCHHPGLMTHDNLPLSLGEGAVGFQTASTQRRQETARVIARNSQALFNLHEVNVFFWDGRVSYDPHTNLLETPTPLPEYVRRTLKSALATQAIFPLVDHDEMRGLRGSNPIANAASDEEAWQLIVNQLLSAPSIASAFAKVFPGQTINIGHVGEAIAEFERHGFFFSDTPFDRYLKGNLQALGPQEKEGMEVFFNRAQCGNCHLGPHLTSFEFKSIAGPQVGPGKERGDDLGRYQWDKRASRYSFRVPPLRNIALTAPYMHNGVFQSLSRVVDHYDDIRQSLMSFMMAPWPNYNPPLRHDHRTDNLRLVFTSGELQPMIGLSPEEKSALLKFLEVSLTDVRLVQRKK